MGSCSFVPTKCSIASARHGSGVALWYLGEQFLALRNAAGRFYWMPQAGWWWIVWTLLAEPFLAGVLLVFRATGYRLGSRPICAQRRTA